MEKRINRDMKELIYVSGGISGVENAKEKFLAAGKRLADEGNVVFLPTEAYHDLGSVSKWGWKNYMRQDLTVLQKCDSVYMLEGWQKSRGAKIEHWLAKRKGLKVIYEEESFHT